MKQFFLVVIYSLLGIGSSYSQPQAISIEYNDFAFLKNINLNYRHGFFNNSFSVYGGLGCYLNNNLYIGKLFPDLDGAVEEGAIFYNISPTNLYIRTGIKIGLEKTVKLPGSSSSAFVFYDFQYYSPQIDGSGFLPPNGSTTPQLYHNFRGQKADLYLQHIGFGFRAKVYKTMNVKLMASLGAFKVATAGFIWNTSENIPQSWQFSRMFGVGVEYNLYKEKEVKKKKKHISR